MCKNNGYLSESINMRRGMKEGCPLSALLFILVVEIFALRVKQNKGIIGYYSVKLNGKQFKKTISQYADDTTLFLSGDNEIPEVLKEIDLFSDNTGPKLNLEKIKDFL